MKKKAAVINLGCPKNQVDSEVIAGMLSEDFNLVRKPSEADIIIVNTCGFIDVAKEESIEVLLELAQQKRNNGWPKIYAVGCLAQRYGKQLLKDIPELDGVLGDGELNNIIIQIKNNPEQRIYSWKKTQDFLYSHEMPRKRSGQPFFAYIKIAEGCNNCCSYCAIPAIKGRYRSRTKESILKEARSLAGEGVKEISLVAQDITRYGSDIYGNYCLAGLLKELARIEGLEWIRLMYCYPDSFTDELIEIIGNEPKICNYVDLPLQHADNGILAAMNRRSTTEEVEILIAKLRKKVPGIFIRSTFITGFPGESEEQFQNLVQFIRRVKFDRLGVFAYSQEENTPAGQRKDQIPIEIREDRKEDLMAVQAEIVSVLQQARIGRILRVILEEELSAFNWIGRSEGDAPNIDGQIYIKTGQDHVPGDIINVRILQADSYDFSGEELE